MSDEPLADVPDLPTVKSETGIELLVGSWRGIAAPPGVGEDIVAALSAALETAWNPDAFVAFTKERGFGLIYRDAAGFGEFMAAADAANGSVMEAAGFAKKTDRRTGPGKQPGAGASPTCPPPAAPGLGPTGAADPALPLEMT